MPVSFQAEAGPQYYTNLYYNQQANQQAALNAQVAAARARGGGGSDIQDAINHRDAMAFQQQQLLSQNEQNQAGINAASVQQQQKFSLEAELSQTQLTQQETMRLQRMKNAIGDVQNDPTLSDDEKADMTTQLKTGISPLEQRATKQKMLQQQQMNEQIVQQHSLQNALMQQQLKSLSATADSRQSFIPDVKALSDISSDLQDKIPQGIWGRDQIIQGLATQEAQRQGLGTHVLLGPDGKKETTIRDASGALGGGGSGSSRSGGGGGGYDHPLGIGPDQYMKMHTEAMKEADLEQKAEEGDPSTGGATKRKINPQDSDWKEKRTNEIMQQKVAALQQYNGMKNNGVRPGTYDPSKAQWNQTKRQPQTPAGAVGPNGAGAAGGSGGQPQEDQGTVQLRNTKFQEQANTVLNRDDLPQNVRTQAAEKIGVMRRLLNEAGGNIANLPEAKRGEYKEAFQYLEANVPRVPGQAPAAPTAAATEPAAPQTWWSRQNGNFNNGLGVIGKGASELADSVGRGSIEAPTLPEWMKRPFRKGNAYRKAGDS